jgi:NodT family efflux transporter outer membrane factor (OMF) lipoprotein
VWADRLEAKNLHGPTVIVVALGVLAASSCVIVRLRVMIFSVLALPLAACAVGPDFVPPAAPLADKFIGANNRSVKSASRDYRDWWRAFHDPTLNRLIDIAYNQNLTLLSAGTRVLQARAALGIAIGLFYPQVQQATGSLIYNRTSAATPLAPPNATPTYFWTDSLALQASWELDFWGKFRRGVESADAAYLASIASYDDVLVSLLSNVATTYVGLRTTEQLIVIARENVRKQRDALEIARAKYTGGTASERDVFQATNVLTTTQAAIPQLTFQLQQATNALCILLGIPPQPLNSILRRSRGLPTPPRAIMVGIPADLLSRRPDVRAAELAAEAQSAQIGVAEAELYPALSISGTFGGSASNANNHSLGDVVALKGLALATGPSFQWNILNYGQITNNVRLQDAKLQQLLVDYQSTVLSAQQDVDNGISLFQQSRSQAAFLRQSTNAARGALQKSIEEYRAGATDFTTVLTAEQNLFQAQSNLTVAESNVSLGAINVYRALGGGWQIREDSQFVTTATNAQMRSRTNWGELLPPASEPQPPAPGLPSPGDVGPTVRPPQW